MNTIAYFEIQASHPDKAIIFYQNVFGWKFFKEELLPIEYYQIQTDGINGGLLKRPAKTPPSGHGTNAFTCSVMVDSFDEIAQKILVDRFLINISMIRNNFTQQKVHQVCISI